MPANIGRPRAERGNANGILGDGVVGGVHPGGRFRRQAGEYGQERDGNLHGCYLIIHCSPHSACVHRFETEAPGDIQSSKGCTPASSCGKA